MYLCKYSCFVNNAWRLVQHVIKISSLYNVFKKCKNVSSMHKTQIFWCDTSRVKTHYNFICSHRSMFCSLCYFKMYYANILTYLKNLKVYCFFPHMILLYDVTIVTCHDTFSQEKWNDKCDFALLFYHHITIVWDWVLLLLSTCICTYF